MVKLIKDLSFNCSRIDIVCDNYFKQSLKGHTRINRGTGQYFPFTAESLLPKNFHADFLKNDENKIRLNEYLAEKLMESDFGDVLVVVSVGEKISANRTHDDIQRIEDLYAASKHEEADVKIIPHVRNCADNGHESVLIQTVDTDVLVLLLAHSSVLSNLDVEVDFGFGSS